MGSIIDEEELDLDDVLAELTARCHLPEEEEEEHLRQLLRQLETVQNIRKELDAKDGLVQTLRDRLAVLTQEAEVVPSLRAGMVELEAVRAHRDQLLQTEVSLHEQHKQQAQRLSDEMSKSKDLHSLYTQLHADVNETRQRLVSEQETHAETRAERDTLRKEARTHEAARVSEAAKRRDLERRLDEANQRAERAEADRAGLVAQLNKTSKQRDALEKTCKSSRAETAQWQSLYQDLETSVSNYRHSAAAVQAKHAHDRQALEMEVGRAQQAEMQAAAAANAAQALITLVSETIDTVISTSPRARAEAEGRIAENEPFSSDEVAVYRAELRAAMRILSRQQPPDTHPALATHFQKIVTFLNDVIVDSVSVQEESQALRARLQIAGDAVGNATALLSQLEEQLQTERAANEELRQRGSDAARAVEGALDAARSMASTALSEVSTFEREESSSMLLSRSQQPLVGTNRESSSFSSFSSSSSSVKATLEDLPSLLDTLVRHCQAQSATLKRLSSSHIHTAALHKEQQDQLSRELNRAREEAERAAEAAERERDFSRSAAAQAHAENLHKLEMSHATAQAELASLWEQRLVSLQQEQEQRIANAVNLAVCEEGFRSKLDDLCESITQAEQQATEAAAEHSRCEEQLKEARVAQRAGQVAASALLHEVEALYRRLEYFGAGGDYGLVVKALLSSSSFSSSSAGAGAGVGAEGAHPLTLSLSLAESLGAEAEAKAEAEAEEQERGGEDEESSMLKPLPPCPTVFSPSVLSFIASASASASGSRAGALNTRIFRPSLRAASLAVLAALRLRRLLQHRYLLQQQQLLQQEGQEGREALIPTEVLVAAAALDSTSSPSSASTNVMTHLLAWHQQQRQQQQKGAAVSNGRGKKAPSVAPASSHSPSLLSRLVSSSGPRRRLDVGASVRGRVEALLSSLSSSPSSPRLSFSSVPSPSSTALLSLRALSLLSRHCHALRRRCLALQGGCQSLLLQRQQREEAVMRAQRDVKEMSKTLEVLSRQSLERDGSLLRIALANSRRGETQAQAQAQAQGQQGQAQGQQGQQGQWSTERRSVSASSQPVVYRLLQAQAVQPQASRFSSSASHSPSPSPSMSAVASSAPLPVPVPVPASASASAAGAAAALAGGPGSLPLSPATMRLYEDVGRSDERSARSALGRLRSQARG